MEPARLKMDENEEKTWTRDLGCFYAVKDMHEKALDFFGRCLDVYEIMEKPKDPFVLYRMSISLRALVKPEEAVESATEALTAEEKKAVYALEVGNGLMECNLLENSYMHFHTFIKKHIGQAADNIRQKLDALEGIFDDCVGEAYLSFLNSQKDAVVESWRLNEMQKHIDERPLWKIQKALGNCDVLSILEKEEILLCPIEAARRQRALTVFNQYYLGISSKDLAFLTDCLKNDALLLHYSIEITPLLKEIIHTGKKNTKRYLSMMHCRNPLYNVNYRKFSRPGQAYQNMELNLNQVQNLTRKKMHNILRIIKIMRKKSNLKKLTDYIEEQMSEFTASKTLRVMPMRFEFTCEVYNHLGLAYLEPYPNYFIQAKRKNLHGKAFLLAAFNLHEEETKPIVKTFGDKSSYIEQLKNEKTSADYKKFLQKMDSRLRCARFHIERSYIYLQMGHRHLVLHYYDMTLMAAMKGAKEAKMCNSNLWELLNLFEVAKVQIHLAKYEVFKENLLRLFELASALKSANLCSFVSECFLAAMQEFNSRKSRKMDRLGSHTSSLSIDDQNTSN